MLTAFTLTGPLVRLEPLSLDHVDALALAAQGGRDTFRYTWVPDGRDETEAYVRAALAQPRAVPFVVRRLADDALVGSTRFLDLDVFGVEGEPSDERPPSVVEVGHTWYAQSAQRTAVNTATKLLLLGHAFDGWGVLRVTLKTDARNAASRNAIERIGGKFEGVRRAHMPATDGSVRDTAYYSIVAAEWPDVRAGLTARLDGAGL